MSKVPTGGGAWLKGSDIQLGDTVTIKDEADWVHGEYKGKETRQYCATVIYKGEDRTLKFTKLSRENCLALGSDSIEWIGKQIDLTAVDIMVDGQMHKTIVVKPAILTPAAQTPLTPEQQAKVDAGEPWDDE